MAQLPPTTSGPASGVNRPERVRVPVGKQIAPQSGLQPVLPESLARGPAERQTLPLRGLLEKGLGPVELPEPMQLVAALRAAAGRADLADRAAPGLGALVKMVIEDETAKLDRYMDLRGQ